MEWTAFKDKFHPSWHAKMKGFIESKECDEIYAFLKTQSQAGKLIAPQSINTFRAFKETPLDELLCVLVGMDPYYKFVDGKPVADGLLFGCSITEKPQPSLEKFYGGIEKELFNGLNLNFINDWDVSYLAKQGVLMLNSALTVEKDKAGSHKDVWLPFTKFLLKEIIGPTGVPVVFMGKEAQVYTGVVEHTNPTFEISHPASASYVGGLWDTKDTFTKVNECIWGSNKETIMWLNADVPF